MFGILLRARFRMLKNAALSASLTHKIVITVLVLFGLFVFTGIGYACSLLVTVMQSGASPGEGLSTSSMVLIYHVNQYMFYFLLAGSVPFVASSLFQDQDLPLLLTSPIRPVIVIASKMIDAIVTNSAQFLVLGVPVLVGVCHGVQLSTSGWIWCIISIILLIILTPSITAFLLTVLALVFGMKRVRFVVMLVSVGMALSITMFAVISASRMTQGGSNDYRHMAEVLTGHSQTPEELRTSISHTMAESVHGKSMYERERSISTPWMPSSWVAEVVVDSSYKHTLSAHGVHGILTLTIVSALLIGFVLIIGQRLIVSDAILEQQDIENFGRGDSKRAGIPLPGLTLNVTGLLIKDLRYVGRDTILIGQIGTTLILYLVPFVLRYTQPVTSSIDISKYSDLTIVMICLIVFMVTSIMGLSSVGLEGKGAWVVFAAPLQKRAFLYSKWLLSFIVSGGLVLVMVLLAALIYQWPLDALLRPLLVLLPACFALSGLGVGLAGIFPRFLYDNPAHRASVWAMIIGFVFSTFYVVVCLTLFVFVWYSYTQHLPTANHIGIIGLIGFIVMTIGTGYIPINIAEQRLSQYEWNYS